MIGFRLRSIAVSLIVIIVSVSVVLMLGFGIVNYQRERAVQWAELNQGLKNDTDFLASSLVLPLWNVDLTQLQRVQQSGFLFPEITCIAVEPIEGILSPLIYVRQANGEIRQVTTLLRDPSLLHEMRVVNFRGDELGRVQVFASTELLESRLAALLRSVIWNIIAQSLALVVVLYLLLWWVILRPIRELERYADSVASMGVAISPLATFRFHGELASLRHSVQTMVSIMETRFQQMAKSESRFRSVFNGSGDAIFVRSNDSDPQLSTFIEVNDVACRMLGYRREELLCLGAEAVTVDYTSEAQVQARRRIAQEGHAVFQSQLRAKDGSVVPVEMHVVRSELSDGDMILSVARDLRERQSNEARLHESLREKEVLIRELYHRTKNNMQVINAMLSIAASGIEDEYVRRVFADMENRILSMALVHQKLYQSHSLTNVDLREYCNELVDLLAGNYLIEPERVRLIKQVEAVTVLVDTAIPCGLLINELVTNSFKHAFPQGRHGTLTIGLKREADGTICLRVADDGIGLAPGLDPRHLSGMGLLCVYSIGEHQLNGTVDCRSDQGLTWEIRFRDTLYVARVDEPASDQPSPTPGLPNTPT